MNKIRLSYLLAILLIFSGLFYNCEQEKLLNESEINDSLATVNDKNEITIAIEPGKVSVQEGKSYQFSAKVSNAKDLTVTWKVVETGGGKVTDKGYYTAPASAGTYHLQVTSNVDNSKTATAEIIVKSAVYDAEARAKVLKDYQENYLTSSLTSTQAKWSGDVASCKPGDTAPVVKEMVLKRVNYFRRQAGLPDNIVMNSEKNKKCQEMALMIKANKALDHSPAKNWSCYTDDGALAAGKSNIGWGVFGPRAISAYMNDHEIATAGHRRWILYSKLKEVGTGDTGGSNALWVIGDNYKNFPADMPEFISWPPPGYVPEPLAFYRWSFSVPNAGFSNAKVSVKKPDGSSLDVALEEVKNGFGDNTLVWMVSGMKWHEIEDELILDVTVQNVIVDKKSKNYQYKVVIFKP